MIIAGQQPDPPHPPVPGFKSRFSCAPSALEDLLDVLAAILVRRLEIVKFLAQILDICFQLCGFAG